MAGVKGKSGGPRANSGGARPNAGGMRPNSGPKPKAPVKIRSKKLETTDPDEFLSAVMANPNIDFKLRMEAALALKKAGSGAGAKPGKREAQAGAARDVVARGRSLAPATAPTRPRLVAVK